MSPDNNRSRFNRYVYVPKKNGENGKQQDQQHPATPSISPAQQAPDAAQPTRQIPSITIPIPVVVSAKEPSDAQASKATSSEKKDSSEKNAEREIGKGALACSILSIVFAPLILAGIVLSIIGIAVGNAANKKNTYGYGKSARILGIIGLVFSLIVAFVLIFSLASIKSLREQFFMFSGDSAPVEQPSDNGNEPLNDNLAPVISNGNTNANGNITDAGNGLIMSDRYGSYVSPMTPEQNEAQSVVLDRLDQIRDGDSDVLNSIAVIVEDSWEKEMGFPWEDNGVNINEYLRWMTDGFEYEVLSIEIDENGALVDVYIYSRDIYELTAQINTQLEEYIETLDSPDLTTEEFKANFSRIFNSVKANFNDYSASFAEFSLTSRGGNWVINGEDWDNEMEELFSLTDQADSDMDNDVNANGNTGGNANGSNANRPSNAQQTSVFVDWQPRSDARSFRIVPTGNRLSRTLLL